MHNMIHLPLDKAVLHTFSSDTSDTISAPEARLNLHLDPGVFVSIALSPSQAAAILSAIRVPPAP